MALLSGVSALLGVCAWADAPSPSVAVANGAAVEQHSASTGAHACPSDRPTILVWLSPRMPYAFSEWPRLNALLQNLPNQPHIQVLGDPTVGEAEWLSAASASRWPQTLQRLPLVKGQHICRSMQIDSVAHYPTLFVAQGARTHPWPIQGVMPSAQWTAQIRERLAGLHEAQALAPAMTAQSVPAIASYAPATAAPHNPNCIAAAQVLPIQGDGPAAELGNYERISPDGRFVLRSYSGAGIGQVALVELPTPDGNTLTLHPTSLRNEAFPVQGSWRFLIDIDGSHHRFSDVLRLGVRAKPLFKAGMTGFYASASEMPGDGASVHIRSLSWPQGDGNSALGDGDDAAIGPLQLRSLRIADEWPTHNRAKVLADTGPQFLCGLRNNHDGAVYALPMLSIGGDSFSAVPQSPRTGTPSMRSYALNPQALASAHSCALQQNLGVAPSKAVFGFASANALPNLVYSDNAQVVLHDGALDRSFVLPPVKHQQLASAFPGITRDGRIVFAATWRDCETGTCPQQAGYLVLDPYQNPAYQAARQAANLPLKSCITRSEVATERKRFADFHGIPAMGQFAP